MQGLSILILELQSLLPKVNLLLLLHLRIAFDDLFHHLTEVENSSFDEGASSLGVLHLLDSLLIFLVLSESFRLGRFRSVLGVHFCWSLQFGRVEVLSQGFLNESFVLEELETAAFLLRYHSLHLRVSLFVCHLRHKCPLHRLKVYCPTNMVHFVNLGVELQKVFL